MFEFDVPREHHIAPQRDPAGLLPLTLGILGHLAAGIARQGTADLIIKEARTDLRFAAYYFDAYLNSSDTDSASSYLTLLAAAAYYLCDLPGSAAVLTNRLQGFAEDPECRALDLTLLWLLKGRFDNPPEISERCYRAFITNAASNLIAFFREGIDENEILSPLKELRDKAYRIGTNRELLLADIIYSVCKRRVETSARSCLPRFTDLAATRWSLAFAKATFVKELWPAQRLLGENDVFRGRSAVVQMPTSAGKTRATEILIRSAFYSDRTKLAVVVAPFRALCHEIRDSLSIAFTNEDILIDEISDIPQDDFDLEELTNPRVLILTPEKLLYLTRQKDDLVNDIGLLIYDEGHQFDTGTRGVTYELLITSLKAVVKRDCQVVLISAVMSNAGAINEWLNGPDGKVVSGSDLLPNQRSIAFASWLDTLGRLEYLAQSDSGDHTYFVPRVLESVRLNRLPRERQARFFPERDDEQAIALYLALKLVKQGAVAVFCGRKSTVTKLCKRLVVAYAHSLTLATPRETETNENALKEIERLKYLVGRHYGSEGPIPDCASFGIFTHHGSTPTGIRLAVEYAMKESLVRMVICTSTLAQGVNLPIRYLIVTGVYQGEKPITVRDFQNLIGRAGRAGMHTEGSVIFSNPETYDKRATREGRWRWRQVLNLLDPTKAEECASSLLSIFDPWVNDAGSDEGPIGIRTFVNDYLTANADRHGFAERLSRRLSSRKFSLGSLEKQIQHRGQIIAALESFLMAESGDDATMLEPENSRSLVRGTLAYHLADPEQRQHLEWIFETIAANLLTRVPTKEVRKAYSRSLFGAGLSLQIHGWVKSNIEVLSEPAETGLLNAIWPMISLVVSNSVFRRVSDQSVLIDFTQQWMDGDTISDLLAYLVQADVRLGQGNRAKVPDIDAVVELSENAIAFEGVLVVAAIIQAAQLELGEEAEALTKKLEAFQKKLKYGLPTTQAILIYEAGFADRIIALELSVLVGSQATTKRRIMRLLRDREFRISEALNRFPEYYRFVWARLLSAN